MSPQRPHSRLPSRLPGALALWLLLLVTGALLVPAPAAAGTASKSSKASKSGKASASAKKKKKKPKAAGKQRPSAPEVWSDG